jgi:starch synthase
VWDPATDPNIPARYSADEPGPRADDKAALQARLGLEQRPDVFLLGVISRISWQKGLDLLIECLPDIAGEGVHLALLGSGDAELQSRFRQAAEAHPGRIGVVIGYDERLAHLIQAGSDALVVPSRFEPCGLTQLCALRYGAVPIVAGVGGLEDTVTDDGEAPTGFKFHPVTSGNLAATIRRAHAAFQNRSVWRGMQTNGMNTDVSWRGRAARYAELYREIAQMRHVAM